VQLIFSHCTPDFQLPHETIAARLSTKVMIETAKQYSWQC
jgi:hypothetical protein